MATMAFTFSQNTKSIFFLSTAMKMKQLTVRLTGFTDGYHMTNREKSWKKISGNLTALIQKDFNLPAW